MKVNELMVSDLVYNHRNWICSIVEIHKDSAVIIAKHYGEEEFKLDDLRPIPLTPEILEKNGFIQCEPQGYDLYVKDKEGEGLYRIFWQGESLNYYLEIDTYAYPFGEFGNVNIKYVHQLQHALRLCKIDKTITL